MVLWLLWFFLDVQVPAGDRERRVILVEAGRTLFLASCVIEEKKK